ncbi:hypothetical protein [Nonomuraea recticatena]|uniref:hypothetical protein n=1 Tax=Nonomuraea recticatena TaxID=46178 RepID=UPI003618689C
MGLFTARAVEGLKDEGRVLLAYGASERTPMLALKVQNALSDLNLAHEAVYPDFNRYFGAEAIGSAADLYILRPTSKTRPAVAARVERYSTAIYTHGPQSIESGAVASPDRPAAFDADLLVGDWPKQLSQPRVKLTTWLAKPHATAPSKVAIAVPSGLEAALPRLLLATRAAHVRVHLAAPPRSLPPLSAVYEITADGAVLDAVRLPPPADEEGRVLRRILDNGHGKLANTWREGLIAVAQSRGVALTKNDARALIRQAAPWAETGTVLEMPLHRLESLASEVAGTVAALPADRPRRAASARVRWRRSRGRRRPRGRARRGRSAGRPDRGCQDRRGPPSSPSRSGRAPWPAPCCGWRRRRPPAVRNRLCRAARPGRRPRARRRG